MSVLGGWVTDAVGLFWLPGALVLGAAAVAVLVDAFGRTGAAVRLVALASVLAAGLCAVAAWSTQLGPAVPGVYGGGGLAGAAAVIYLAAAASLLSGLDGIGESRRGGVAALVGLGAVACQVLAGAVDLLVMAIALETLAVVSYGLVAAGRGRAPNEVGMRYLVQGSVAAGFLVFGLAAVVGLGAGQTGYEQLVQTVSASPAAAASVTGILVLVALAFKAGAFPLHSWVPDAYEVVDPGAGVFLAGAPKVAAVLAVWVLFARSVWAQESFQNLRVALAVMAAASIVFGNFAALKQRDVGRMLGYSAIAQVGYALVGVVAGAVGTTLLVAGYAIAVAVAFGCVGALQAGSAKGRSLDGIRGIAASRPVLAAVMSVAMLSLTGIPLTMGFLGKLWVFYAAVNAGWTWLALVGAIGSVVSFGYYGKVIQAMYFSEPEQLAGEAAAPQQADETELRRGRVWPFALLAVLLVVAGTVPLATGFEWLLRGLSV
ncbi:MAG: NADH-quinone oxidoreductase subunit N [Anaerosomatales bacterium]|nr:NADH-quinone oxidoreductase subunit N [Anaerosomatales bacterium]